MTCLSLKRAMLVGVLACAGFASHASAADWSPISIVPDEEFYQYRDNLAANPGQVLRYRFNTPAAITQVRIELTGDNGNGELKVFRDSTNAVPACDSRQVGSNELCTLGWTPGANTPAATWFVEVSAKAAFTSAKLVVAYLPKLVEINDLPDLPYVLAHRPAYQANPWTSSACLQVRTGIPGFSLPRQPCMPVGSQQTWDFQRRPNHYLIVNPLTGRCMTGGDTTWVLDEPCNETDSAQYWTVLGSPGVRHFVVLKNQGSGKCMTFNDDPNAAMQVDCRLGEADMPGWALRGVEDRIFPAQADDGATFSQIASVLCIGDAANGAVLTPCDDRKTTRRYMITAVFDTPEKLDWFTEKFLLTAADRNNCIAAEPTTGNVVFRKCDPVDAAQKWTLELYGSKISEWQLRSVQQQKCMTTQGGGITAGTPLALGDCSIGDTKMRWRYVGH